MMMKNSRPAGLSAREDDRTHVPCGVPAGTFGAQCAGKPRDGGAPDVSRDPGKPSADGKSLAMVYGLSQKYEDLYTLSDALTHGTLFADLDKPFHPGFRV